MLSSLNKAQAASFKELCSYDSLCAQLKNPDGSFIPPKPEIIKLLQKMKPTIDEAAKLYDVDPRAIAGAILAENTLNVQVSDAVQDFLVKHKIAKDGKVLGKSFSFGLGQIYPETAKGVEEMAARLEKRSLRNDSEISQEILKPESSIKYAAAILKNTQDIYKKYGIDISNDPAILTTLYNLGGPETRAKETKKLGGKPKVNYFGFFVDQNLDQIENKSGIKRISKDSVNLSADETKMQAPEEAILANKDIEKQTVAINDITLFRGPSNCKSDGAGSLGEEKRWNTFKSYGPVGFIKPNQKLKVVDEGLGCGMEDWVLVQNTKGVLGWVKKSDFDNRTNVTYDAKSSCKESNVNCGDKLSKVSNFNQLKDEEATSAPKNIQQIGIVGSSDSSWKYPNNRCITKEESTNQAQNYLGPKANVASGKVLKSDIIGNDDWAKQALDEINEAKLESLKLLNEERKRIGYGPLANWDSEENLFYPILANYDKKMIQQITKCASNEWLCSPPSAVDLDNKIKVYKRTITKDYSNNNLWGIMDGAAWQLNNIREVYLGEPKGSSKWAKERDAALSEIAKCDFLSENSASKPVLKEVQNYIKENGVTNVKYRYSHELNNPLMSLKYVGELCDKVFKPNSNKSEMSKEVCDYAKSKNYSVSHQISVLKLTLGSDETIQNSLLSHINEWVETVKDKIDMNKLILMYKGVGSSNDKCGYNQFKTAKLIEDILKHECVKNIYIEDPWILNYFADKSSKVIFKEFSSENRFAVEFNNVECD